MKSGVAVFRSEHELYHSDTCEPLRRAVERGETSLTAFARGAYPGLPLPDEVLREVRSVGCWHAHFNQDWGLDWHRNEGIELTYLSKGSSAFTVDDNEYLLKAGNLTITRPWQLHKVGNPTISACTLYWLMLDVGVRRPNQAWKWPAWLGLADCDVRDLTVLLSNNEHTVWSANTDIGGCFERLGEMISLGRPEESESRIRLLIGELLLAVTNLLRGEDPELDSSLVSTGRTVRLFLQSLESRLDEPWTLSSMARTCGIGRSRFSQHCQRITNMSPGEYLSYIRVRGATKLLRSERSMLVIEVAFRCGFASSQYFATVFRKHTGCTPTAFRLSANPLCLYDKTIKST